MIKLLRAVPRWLTVPVAAICAAIGFVVTVLSRNLSGALFLIAVICGAGCIAVGLLITQLEKWQEKQDQRLDLELTLENSPNVPDYRQVDLLIGELLEQLRESCLESLREAERAAKSREERSQLRPRSFSSNKGSSPSTREILELEKRREAGEQLSDEDLAKVREAAERVRAAISSLSVLNLPRTAPDRRTRDDYLTQVDEFVKEAGKSLEQLALWNYSRQGCGELRIKASTQAKLAVKELQVELTIEGPVEIFDPELIPEPAPMPDPPRAFGLPEEVTYIRDFSYSALHSLNSSRILQPLGPFVGSKVGTSVSVTFDSVTLRPGGSIPLDKLRLLARADAGTTIRAKWAATATNVERRVEGSFDIQVSGELFNSEEILLERS